MSTGEEAFLALAIVAFLSYIGVLAYGVAVASNRPDEVVEEERPRPRSSSSHMAPQARQAHQAH